MTGAEYPAEPDPRESNMRVFRPLLLIPFVLVLAASTFAQAADQRPNSLDAAARARLVGDHLLTLQWLGWDDLSRAGTLVVKDRGDTLAVNGEQRGSGENKGDYLRIDGRIVSASRDGFVFEGKIATRVHHIADGEECKRDGTFTFKTRAGRKYWRMQEMDNPCDTATDYIDVYFRGL